MLNMKDINQINVSYTWLIDNKIDTHGAYEYFMDPNLNDYLYR